MTQKAEPEREAIQQHRHEILEQLEEWLDGPMVVLSFVWLALLVVELMGELSPALDWLLTIIWGLFILEFVLELFLAPDKSDYLKRNWLLVLSLLAPALRVFRLARVLRAARAARTLTLVRVMGSMNYNLRMVREVMRRRGVGYVVVVTLIVMVIGAAGMFIMENEVAPNGGMSSFGYAFWWTAMLMTTLGADYTPQSVEGRILMFLLALYATGVFGYITATLASFFVGRDAADEEGAIAGERSIQALRQEIQALQAELRAEREERR